MVLRYFGQMLRAGADVVQGAGPTTAGLADAAVFEIPGGESGGSEGGAEMAGVAEIVGGAPVTAVQENDGGVRTFVFGDAEVAELIGVGAVGDAGVGRGRREFQDGLREGGGEGAAGHFAMARISA